MKKFGGMKEWKDASAIEPAELDKAADFVATFAAIPNGLTPADWVRSAEVAKHPRPRGVRGGCGDCHVIEGLTKGGMRKAPQIFGWGSSWWIARMVRDPRSSDKYGFLDSKHPGQMPVFGDDQVSASDLEAFIRYLKGDYPEPDGPVAAH